MKKGCEVDVCDQCQFLSIGARTLRLQPPLHHGRDRGAPRAQVRHQRRRLAAGESGQHGVLGQKERRGPELLERQLRVFLAEPVGCIFARGLGGWLIGRVEIDKTTPLATTSYNIFHHLQKQQKRVIRTWACCRRAPRAAAASATGPPRAASGSRAPTPAPPAPSRPLHFFLCDVEGKKG